MFNVVRCQHSKLTFSDFGDSLMIPSICFRVSYETDNCRNILKTLYSKVFEITVVVTY